MILDLLNSFVRLIEVTAWPVVALIVVYWLKGPVGEFVSRASTIKVGKDGMELIVTALEKEQALQPGQRMELLGLSSNEIWALESFSKGQIPLLAERLNPAQKVAARVLSDAGLLRVTMTDG